MLITKNAYNLFYYLCSYHLPLYFIFEIFLGVKFTINIIVLGINIQ